MSNATVRTTKYTEAVRHALAQLRHASNSELLESLRRDFPDLSATTVHRITARLHARGDIGIAPHGPSQVLRYDSTSTPHDHFICSNCYRLRDTIISAEFRHHIEATIGPGCSISGSITISGICARCARKQMQGEL